MRAEIYWPGVYLYDIDYIVNYINSMLLQLSCSKKLFKVSLNQVLKLFYDLIRGVCGMFFNCICDKKLFIFSI